MKQSGIYQIQSKIKPERIYIGSSINIDVRWREHLNLLKKGVHHSQKLQRHYNKYGKEDLAFSIIEPCFSDWLITREQYYLDKLNPYFNNCKLAYSCRGVVRSAEVKKKISESLKGRKMSPEFCQKLSKRMRGKRYMLGKKISADSKEKISRANKGKLLGKKQNPEHINKRVQKLKGRFVSQEERDKISEANEGKRRTPEMRENQSIRTKEHHLKFGHPCIGKVCSAETRRKIGEKNKGHTGGWNKGISCTEESKKNLSMKMKGKYAGSKNPNFGKHLTPEQKLKLSESIKIGLLRKKEIENSHLKIA